MKKILSLWLIFSVFSIHSGAFSALKNKTNDIIDFANKSCMTYLICGQDDAAGNTDTIMLASYNNATNSISFIHIPRDSFFNYGTEQNKINQVVPFLCSTGKSRGEAIADLTEELQACFGIEIDGYLALTTDATQNLIDTLGGIEIDLPFDLTITDKLGNNIQLKAGTNKLDGVTAVGLLRHRKSYSLGDLSRIDMQKLFLSSFIKEITSGINPGVILKLVTNSDAGVVSNIDLLKISGFLIKNLGRIKKSELKFTTLPGLAVESKSGLSYYAVNKNGTEEILNLFGLSKSGSFDEGFKFTSKELDFINDVYLSESIEYKISSGDDVIN